MSKKLKGVIFTINNILTSEKRPNYTIFREIKRLIKFIQLKNLQPVVLANHPNENLEKELTNSVGKFPWFIGFRDGFGAKQTKGATTHVLSTLGWDATEAIYVGNSMDDMRTARNGSLLFLNAVWYGKKTNYGIEFSQPWDIGRFIDIFCLRDSLWGYSVIDGKFEYYSLAPFSTFNPAYSRYSENARSSAKNRAGNIDFWAKYLWSTIYFSELYKRIDFVAPFPGHKSNFISTASDIIEEPMLAFTKCFGIEYLTNLIIRHEDALKSQLARQKKQQLDHINQLDTIHLNPTPLKGSGKRYNNTPLMPDKTVLVVDDFCTEGHSLDAARVYIKKTGANVICLSWLKTINTNYRRILTLQPPDFDPYQPNKFSDIRYKEYNYHTYLTDTSAPEEIDARLRAYDDWFEQHWLDEAW